MIAAAAAALWLAGCTANPLFLTTAHDPLATQPTLVAMLVGSTLSMLTAAVLSLWLMRTTSSRRLAWFLVSIAALLLTVRGGLSLYEIFFVDRARQLQMPTEVLGLATGMLLVSGVCALGGLFSEIRTTKGKLAASEERSRLLIDAALDAVVSIDSTGIITGWNKQAETIFGWKEGEACGRSISQTIIPPSVRGTQLEGFTRRLLKEDPRIVNRRIEFTAMRRDGSEFPVELAVTSLSNGGSRWFSVFIRDITERKTASDALRASEERFRRVVESNMIGILFRDEAGTITEANDVLLSLIGYTREDLSSGGLHSDDLTPPEYIPHDRKALEEIKAMGVCTPFEKEYIHKDGHRIPILIGAAALDSDGTLGVCFVLDVTEQKRAEAALRESSSLLEQAQAIAQVGSWVSDQDKAGTLAWSRETCRIFGLSEAEFDGHVETFFSMVHPDDLAMVRSAAAAAFRGEVEYNVQHRIVRRDGTERWVHQRAQVVLPAGGEAPRMLGVCQDITERRASEEALRLSEARYRRLAEHGDIGIWEVTLTGESIYCNPPMCKLLEVDNISHLGDMNFMSFFTPSSISEIKRHLERRMRGEASTYEVDLVGMHGGQRRVLIAGAPAATSSNKPVSSFIATFTDVTELKRAEAEVLGWKNRYEAASVASSQLVYEWDSRSGAVIWGGDSERILGCPLSDLGDTDQWLDRIHPDDRAAFRAETARVIETKAPFHLEYRVRHEAGHYIHTLDTGQFFRSSDGEVSRMTGFVGDITERVLAREQLARHAAELARSNTELERFAYVASHDLQEPLRMVTSFTQLLASRYAGKLGPDADEFIGFAVEGATRMQQLIEDLLSYSRVGPATRRISQASSRVALNRALANLHAALQGSGAKVVVEGEMPTVTADESQLAIVFQNLIGNAIKFRRDETPRIVVSAARGEDGWTFSVSDNGIGIHAKHWERIFTMFQRLHPRSSYPGNGIGLAIAKRIVEGYGADGRMWIESEVGKGSTFYFTVREAQVAEEPVHDLHNAERRSHG